MPDQDSERVPHDQAFKQLLAEFPLEALAFFAGDEGRPLPQGAQVTLLRQEQLSSYLGKGHREIDVLLLLDWPDGAQEAIAFLMEEETKPSRDVAFKVAEYLLLVARWLEKERQLFRIVPVVVFVGDGAAETRIEVASSRRTYLFFDCVKCRLAEMDAEEALRTGNLAAAANIMNMRYPTERKIALCAAAMTLWRRRVGSDETVAKFGRYIVRCARLGATEDIELRHTLAATQEGAAVMTIFDRERAQGRAEGRIEAIFDLLQLRGVALSDAQRQRIADSRDPDQLRLWFVRASQVSSGAELFAEH